jgi:hypothetical protein
MGRKRDSRHFKFALTILCTYLDVDVATLVLCHVQRTKYFIATHARRRVWIFEQTLLCDVADVSPPTAMRSALAHLLEEPGDEALSPELGMPGGRCPTSFNNSAARTHVAAQHRGHRQRYEVTAEEIGAAARAHRSHPCVTPSRSTLKYRQKSDGYGRSVDIFDEWDQPCYPARMRVERHEISVFSCHP